jgi:PAS domain S-box-containing protein
MTKPSNLHSEESFLQILNAIGDMVLVKGPESKLLWANEAFCKYYGMSNEQLRGIIDAPFSAPDNTLQYVIDDAKVFNSGKILDIPEENVTRHDGVSRQFHTVKTPIFDESKKVIMTVGISRDITERKEAEERLKIERERSSYSSKMATLGEMAGGVAHEVNTPLATITLLAEQCSDLLNEKNPDLSSIKENILNIEKTTARIAKIVAGLRSFSRDGKHDPVVSTKVSQVIEDTLSFSRERFFVHGIALTVKHASQDPSFHCRSIEISQVILNLLNNGHDAAMDSDEKWVRLESEIKGNKVEISVTNSGPIIPVEMREKLFVPFFTTKEIGKGTGLGLSISKGIVEAHGGTIFLDAKAANTRFVITFPVSK